MTLRELMKLHGISLQVSIIEKNGEDLLSVVLRGATFPRHECAARASFPGWGRDFDSAVLDLIDSINKHKSISISLDEKGGEQIFPLSRITSFS